MPTSAKSPEKKNSAPDKKSGGSASSRATKKARKGEPLSADRPSQRSPKQENL